MLDGVEGEQAGAEAESQQAAPEVTQATNGGADGGAAASQQQASPSWKVGDTAYTDPNEMHKAFLKWQGDFTRKNQEYAKQQKETSLKMGQYEAIVNAIRSDETLRQQVLQRIQAGQNPQQAVQQVGQQLPPEVVARLEALESAEKARIEDAAIDTFQSSHKDLTNDEWLAMEKYLGENEEEIGDMKPHRQLALAYAEVVVPARHQKAAMASLQSKQKEEESEKGKKSAFLGSQAPTAGAKGGNGLPERKRGATPAEEREYALKVFRASAKK